MFYSLDSYILTDVVKDGIVYIKKGLNFEQRRYENIKISTCKTILVLSKFI